MEYFQIDCYNDFGVLVLDTEIFFINLYVFFGSYRALYHQNTSHNSEKQKYPTPAVENETKSPLTTAKKQKSPNPAVENKKKSLFTTARNPQTPNPAVL